METVLIILLILFGACTIFLYFALRRSLNINDALEDENTALTNSNVMFEQWFNEFKSRAITAYQRIKIIDASGHFEADDEVGYFFTELKSLIERLHELGIIDETEKQEIEEGIPKITTQKLQEVLSQRNVAVFTRKKE